MPVPARLVAALALACSGVAQAQVYAGQDDAGNVVLSNHALGDGSVLLIAPEPPVAGATAAPPAPAAGAATADAAARWRVPAPLEAAIDETARRHALPSRLLKALIWVESRFDPAAVSPKGAKGLMQLMPDTARRYGVKDVHAVADNLRGGAAYLRDLLDRFDDDLPLALAAYNAGEGAVLRAGRKVPDFAETRDYVAKVLAHAGMAAPAAQR